MAHVKKISPILYVESIEPCLSFWDRLGFQKTAEVPHEGRLGFVILARDGLEIMYETAAAVEADLPTGQKLVMGGTMLFIEVDDIDEVERALAGAELFHPRRTAFYGAEEIYVREPAGNVVGFAQFPK
jgi:hypothetical protein